jgi:DHA1 family bicyclomycin/chloramphenicol resistance-like MFS transporter
VACVISGILLLIASISGTREPNIITGIMLLYSVSVALPCNIAYPISLDLLPNSKGKISAFYNSFRLLLTAVGVEVVGCYYNGSFFPIGITIGTTIICAVFFMYHAKLNISDV